MFVSGAKVPPMEPLVNCNAMAQEGDTAQASEPMWLIAARVKQSTYRLLQQNVTPYLQAATVTHRPKRKDVQHQAAPLFFSPLLHVIGGKSIQPHSVVIPHLTVKVL